MRWWFAVMVVFGSAVARAQLVAVDTIPLDRLRLPVDSNGFMATEGTQVLANLTPTVALVANYGRDPLLVRGPNDEVAKALIPTRVGTSLLMGIGVLHHFSIALELPFAFQFADADADVAFAGLGDVRITPKATLLTQAHHGIGVALLSSLTIPTATGSYLGEANRSFSLWPEVVVDRSFGMVEVAAHFGYRLRQPVQYATRYPLFPELSYGAAVGFDMEQWLPLRASLEVFGATADRNPFGLLSDDANANRAQNPLEALLGVRWSTPIAGLIIDGGVGVGLLGGLGTPVFRALLGARYTVGT
jgi:hypothetical protein